MEKHMQKPWWMTKKNEPATDYDEDYDSVYYGKPDPDEGEKEEAEKSTDDLYNGYEDSDISEVRVAWSEESAKEVAKVEPLMKRTFTPKSCQDSQAVVDAYKEGRVVVICVEELDRSNFYRLFDYVMGAVHALDGELRKIDRDTVVLLPYGVDEELSVEELEEEAVSEEENADGKDEA